MLMYIRNVMKREDGATAVEYGLMIAAIAAVIVLIVFALGKVVKKSFNDTCQNIKAGGGTAATGDCTAP